MSNVLRYTRINYIKLIDDVYNFDLLLPELDSSQKSLIKTYKNIASNYKSNYIKRKCAVRTSSAYQQKIKNTNKNNSKKKEQRQAKYVRCITLKNTFTTENTKLMKDIFIKLASYFKNKILENINRLNNPSDKDIDNIAKYINILEDIYNQNRCRSPFNIQNFIVEMRKLNKYYEQNDAYINTIFYKRENQNDIIKRLSYLTPNFKSIIDAIPADCSGSSGSSVSTGFSGRTSSFV